MEQRAEEFRAGTQDHDVSHNIAAMFRYIDGESPFVILDFGCGPGRDLKIFAGLGHTAIGLKGSAAFAVPRALQQLHIALKPGGVLFSSNPHGQNQEGWNRGRYGTYHDLEAWRRYMLEAEFIELEYYYRPTGLPREQQPWLASVWCRSPAKDA